MNIEGEEEEVGYISENYEHCVFESSKIVFPCVCVCVGGGGGCNFTVAKTVAVIW